MPRFLVLVDIEAADPVAAEQLVGGALHQRVGGRCYYFVRQTQVRIDPTSGPFRQRGPDHLGEPSEDGQA